MYYRDDLPVNLEDYLKLYNEVYSDIIKKIIDEYMNALVEDYESLFTDKETLEKTFNKLTPCLEEFNEIMMSKGIKVQFQELKENDKIVVYCISFNNMIKIPIREEYKSLVATGAFELNPIRVYEKLALLKKLKYMDDYEIYLLNQAIKEDEDSAIVKQEISKAESRIDYYFNNYMNNSFNINISIMTNVIKKLYEDGIITDEFLSSIASKTKKTNRAKLSQLIEFLCDNIYHIDYYLSKRNLLSEELNQKSLVLVNKNKRWIPDWYPTIRVFD